MWIDTINILTRVYISDDVVPYKYSDERLNKIALVAAFQVLRDSTFLSQYVLNINTSGIVPDPVELEDNTFINLTSMKTACLLLRAETKIAANNSIRIQDALSEVDTGNRYNNIKDMANNICEDYDRNKIRGQMGDSGTAILTPYEPA
jgi:hypothetical protein